MRRCWRRGGSAQVYRCARYSTPRFPRILIMGVGRQGWVKDRMLGEKVKDELRKPDFFFEVLMLMRL